MAGRIAHIKEEWLQPIESEAVRAAVMVAVVEYQLLGREPEGLQGEARLAFAYIRLALDAAAGESARKRRAVSARWGRTSEASDGIDGNTAEDTAPVQCAEAECTEPIQSAYTECTEPIQSTYTECTEPIQSTYTECTEPIQCTYTASDKEKGERSFPPHPLSAKGEKENININLPPKENKKENPPQRGGMSREVEAEFVAFHRAYPGRKRGYRQELAVLARRRPRDWREVVGQLAPALERLLRWRERAAAAGMYVASHKNLSTWLNQECWTEEFPDIDNPQTLSANENPTTPVGADADRRRLDYAEHIARHLDAGETSEPDIAGLL